MSPAAPMAFSSAIAVYTPANPPPRMTTRFRSPMARGLYRLRDVRGPRGSFPLRQDEAIQTQQFAERPRLERTAPGRERRLGVGDFAHVADPGRLQVQEQRLDEALARLAACGAGIAAHAHP